MHGIISTLVAILLLFLSPLGACQDDQAFIEGTVLDANTGAPLADVQIDIYPADDHSTATASTATNQAGRYNATVPAGPNYDIYVRFGADHPRQQTGATSPNGQYIRNFEISQAATSTTQDVEKYGFWLVVAVAGLIVFLILVDQLVLRKKRVMSELERERLMLEQQIASHAGQADELTELAGLEKEKHKIEYMINTTRTKYHRNQIDEETFREIVRDYQKQLIEVEAKIAGFKEDQQQ